MSFVVLLLEDNAMNLELHRDLLEAAGHEVIVAETAAQFRLQIAGGFIPDVVLLDILLPDGVGTALLSELRARPAYARLPVLAVTAQALTGDVPRLLAQGFDAVITKPIDTEAFPLEVARWAHASAENARRKARS